jgi:diguanylate cyclase (GGDEF)-like protein/PAS domain S-box-containing protein
MWGDVLNQLLRKRRADKHARAQTATSATNTSWKAEARRPNRTLKHFGTILVVLLLAFVAALSWQAWRQEETDSKAELATVAEVGARALDSYLNQLEISLKILAEALSEHIGTNGVLDTGRARDLVRQFHRLHTELNNVAVARANGQVVVSATQRAGEKLSSIVEEPSFKNFSRDVFFVVDLGQPMLNQATKRWVVPVRYRINDRYQSLLYVLSADLPVEFFASFWKHTPITQKASIGVVRDDGFMLSRYPLTGARTEDDVYGAAMSGTLIKELRERSFPLNGAFDGTSSRDGGGRLYVVYRLRQYPLTLFVNMPKSELWEAWWRKVQVSYLLTMVMLFGGAAVFIMTSRRQKTYEASLDRALQASEQASRELDVALDNMSHGIVMFDASAQLVVCNDRYLELYRLPPEIIRPGVTLEDLIDRLVANQIVPVDEGNKNLKAFLADMAAGKSTQGTRELGDGRTIVVTNRPLPDGGWVATHEDITERRRAEQKLEQTQHFLNAVIEYTPAILSVKQVRTQTYALVNRAASLLFGYPSEQMMGKTVHELFPKKQAEYFAARDNEAIGARGLPVVHEHSVSAPHNGTRILATTKLAIPDAAGEPEYLISFSEDITERRQAEASIAFMAHHDPLTGLANRLLLRERMEAALSSVKRGASVALLYLDLDHFKSINDTLGHSVGDEFLKVVAERLKGCIREIDTVARLGGDEFVILLTGVEDASEAEVVARRVREAITTPIEIDRQQIVADASIGISMAPNDASNSEELLKNSDMALYGAKEDGRGTYRFFEPSMDAQVKARRALELDLRKALADNEFELHYQPLVNIARNEVVGCEALLRWHHPTRGMVSPAEFIPVAEDTGLIITLGEWVLQTACAQAARWPSHIKVAVNVSPAQFKSPGLLEAVVKALAAAELPAVRLELEITEAVLLHNNDVTLATLRQLDELGVRIALDDFGTGYSSLSYLRSFPFDKIKIDKSFIHDMTDNPDAASIVRAVTGLATELQMATTAEGVETAEQLQRLREFGCTEMQGYLYSRPLPPEQVLKFFPTKDAKRASQAA